MSLLKDNVREVLWGTFVEDGDESSFQAIYSHYYHYLTFLGGKKGFGIDVTEDTINDVFLYFWENRDRIGHISNHHNYLITSFLRRLYRQHGKQEMVDLNETEIQMESLPSLEELHIQRSTTDEVTQFVMQQIEQLAEKQKQIIYQKFYLNLSYEEIARANSISINTVYNTVYKSIDKVKSVLTKEQETFLKIAIGALSTLFLLFLNFQ